MRQRLLPLLAALAMAACSSPFALRHAQGDTSNTLVPERVTQAQSKWPIKHVVFIIQENRSFNNLFMGYPGATTAKYGYDERHQRSRWDPQNSSTGWDLGHSSQGFFTACDGQRRASGNQMQDGRMESRASHRGPPKQFAYSYVAESEIKPIGKSPSSTCSPTVCSRRTSTAVSSRTSMPSPHMQAGRRQRSAPLGMRRRPARYGRDA